MTGSGSVPNPVPQLDPVEPVPKNRCYFLNSRFAKNSFSGFFFRSRFPHNKLNKLRLLLKKLIDVTLKVLETQI